MHTRGRRGDTMVAAGISGTTHAHAGQTAARLAIKFSSWNHPCTRGADLGALNLEPRTGEPPMHTRGRLVDTVTTVFTTGTTHAHAGQTLAD